MYGTLLSAHSYQLGSREGVDNYSSIVFSSLVQMIAAERTVHMREEVPKAPFGYTIFSQYYCNNIVSRKTLVLNTLTC
jgi:hypothetical protein